jgi:hypothetical protein
LKNKYIKGKVDVKMTNVDKILKEFPTMEDIKKELKRIQSVKCRLKKQQFKSTYQDEMTKTLNYEELLKQARTVLDPKEKPVTQYEQDDVNELNYDETIKAIKSIQSKKTLSKYLTEDIETNEEYQNACKIEQMLLEHKKQIKPLDETVVSKRDLQDMIENLEQSNVSKENIIEMLKNLI